MERRRFVLCVNPLPPPPKNRWHAQELAEAFMERFPEDPIIFATENWRGDTDQVRGFLRRESRG